MTISKLVIVYKPRITTTGLSKRKVKRSKRAHTNDDRVTYRETFNTIVATLTRHGLMGITSKQSLPTLMNVNRPHLELLNNLTKSVIDKHSDLTADFHALDRQQQDAHDTRLVQTDEHRRHYTHLIQVFTPNSNAILCKSSHCNL